MSVTFRDRYQMTVAGAPGTSDITVGSATPSFQAFDSSDNGLTFDIIINDVNDQWEITKDCTYNNGILSRGTFVDSSTGSRISLTEQSIFAVTLLAQRAFPSTITSPTINQVIQFNGSDWVNATLSGGGSYVLPAATTTTLGGVIADGTSITVAVDGTISAGQAASTSVIRQYVKNGSGIDLTKGQAVYITGADGTNVLIGLARANAESTSSKTLGLLEQDLAINAMGWVVTEGALAGLNTDSANAGDPVWLSPTTAGGLVYGLVNKPVAPYHLVYMGVVSRKQLNNGEIFIKVQNGYELDELHNVSTPSASLVNNDILTYETSSGLWKNKQLSSGQVTTALGYTPYDSTNPDGYTTNLGTVTNVSALTIGTSGTDITSTVANSTTVPVITINIPTASATNRGVLSSTDWTTFNNKLSTIPTASTSVLGGIKVDGTSIVINGSGVISSTGGGGYLTNVDGGNASSIYNANIDGGSA